MNERQIDCFLAIAREGSYTKAANRMFLSQPALTHQITTLEKEINATLFRRSAKGVLLTESGQVFLPAAQNLKEAFREARTCIGRSVDQKSPIVLGIPRALMLHQNVYRTLIRRLTDAFPDYTFDIREVYGGTDIYRQLSDGIDCIVTMDLGEEMLHRKELAGYPLFQNQCWIYMGETCPLYPKPELTLDDLRDIDLYYAEYDRHFVNVLLSCLPPETKLKLHEVPTPLTVSHAVVSGKACCILPNRNSVIVSEHAALLLLEDELPVTCAFFLKKKLNPIAEALAELIQQVHREEQYR